MKPIYVLLISSSLSFINCSNQKVKPNDASLLTKTSDDFSDTTTLIITYDNQENTDDLRKKIDSYGATIIYDYKNFNMIAISIPKDKSIEATKEYLESLKGVIAVERNYKSELQNSTQN